MRTWVRTFIHHLQKRIPRRRNPANPFDEELWTDLKRLLSHENAPLCVDVGAAYGGFSARFLHEFPTGRVIAFEPSTTLHAKLQARFMSDSRVTIEKLALGDREARMTLSVFSHPNLNSLLPLSEADCNPFRGEVVLGMEEVQLATLDTLCCNRNIERIHLLKVDTQGFDLHVLEGSADLLEKRRVAFLLVEVNFATIYSGQATPGSLVDFLCSRGYFPFQFYNVRRVPYVPGQGAKSRAWFAQKRLPYPNTGRFPIAWCDVLFAPYVSCDV